MTVFGNKEQLSWYGEVSKHFGGYRQLPKVRIQFCICTRRVGFSTKIVVFFIQLGLSTKIVVFFIMNIYKFIL